MHILAEVETSGPPVIVIAAIAGAVLMIAGLIALYVIAVKDASYRRWQSKHGISPEFQEGKSDSFYLMLFVGVIIAFVTLIFAFPFAQDLGEGPAGDSSESSAVQAPDPER